MFGVAWIDEAAYLIPSRSRLQMALSRHVAWNNDDPSSKKLLRWQLEGNQSGIAEQAGWEDELHCTWTDELLMAKPVSCAEDGTLYDGIQCNGTGDEHDEAETNELVRVFLSGGPQLGGSSGWSRNSLHATCVSSHACARFRAVAVSGRPDE